MYFCLKATVMEPSQRLLPKSEDSVVKGCALHIQEYIRNYAEWSEMFEGCISCKSNA